MINLKDNIWIEGFDSELFMQSNLYSLKCLVYEEIYSCKTSEIPEEIAKECVIEFGLCKGYELDDGTILNEDVSFGFKNYKEGFGELDFKTAKESIQSACDKEYCIIYKKS